MSDSPKPVEDQAEHVGTIHVDRMVINLAGCWVVRYGDWSGIAIFGDELTALRYALEHNMDSCSFETWGQLR